MRRSGADDGSPKGGDYMTQQERERFINFLADYESLPPTEKAMVEGFVFGLKAKETT